MLRPWFRSAKRCFGTSYTVHLVSSQAQAERLSRELLLKLRKRSPNESSIAKIALDCEGVRLGRFGRLSLMQMQDEDGQVMLCDALRPGIVEAFRPLLESPSVVKARPNMLSKCRKSEARTVAFNSMFGDREGGSSSQFQNGFACKVEQKSFKHFLLDLRPKPCSSGDPRLP